MRRSRLVLLVLGLLVLGAGVLVAQSTYSRHTEIFDFINGVRIGSGTTITGTSGSQNSAVVLPPNSVGGGEVSGVRFNVILCGQANETGETFLGPALDVLAGDASASTKVGSTACDSLGNTTEGTADAPLFANVPFKIMGMYCLTDGTLGAGESVVFKTRSAAADTVPSITCTISAGQTDCRSLVGTTTDIAAGATVAISATQTSNNADDNLLCRLQIALQ